MTDAAIQFCEDVNGTRPLKMRGAAVDFGIGLIGKEKTIFIKNTGDTVLRDIFIEVQAPNMKGLTLSELYPGEIKPAIIWKLPDDADVVSFEGDVTVKAISTVR